MSLILHRGRQLGAVVVALAAIATSATAGPWAAAERAAWSTPSADTPPMAHAANLRAELVDAFFVAWGAADEARRDAVRALFAELVSPGAPAELLPSLGAIQVATAVLGGTPSADLLGEDPAAVLALQALSLDLRVRPGLVEAKRSGRPASLTVDLASLYELRSSLDVGLSLVWLGPEGQELVARTEPIAARAFGVEGFQMFVRAPLVEPGLWHLVPELSPRIEDPGAEPGALLLAPVRGRPVPVPIVAPEPGIAGLVQRFGQAATPGARSPLVALLETGERLAPSLYQLASDWLGRELAAPQVPGALPDPDTAPVLLLVEPRDRAGGPSFAGTVGAAWLEAGRSTGHHLAATAPVGAGESPRVTEACASFGDREVTLVVFGDAILATQLEFLRNGAPAIDRLVVVARMWRPTPTMPSVPTLYLTPESASAELAGASAHVTAKLLDDSIFLSATELPGWIAEWLAESGPEDAATADEGR
ncbi:MAG: hypothetical protein P1V81_01300 [Planctomycetota bacterium]|nr:hypothetical protein [Planctomycetota bacterium]